jgi:hypothetical protein
MALTQSLTLTNNFKEESFFADAYLQVSKVTSAKDLSTIELGYFKNNSSPLLITRYFTFTLDLEGPNPIKQAYEHLKSLPEFADAVDC